MNKVNLAQKLALFTDLWSPKVVGEVNDFALKVVKVQGEFVWHHHEQEDELFLVVKGRLGMQVREPGVAEQIIWVEEGEFIVIPHGIEHCPKADIETHVLLLEPQTTINTGNVLSDRVVPYEQQQRGWGADESGKDI